MLLVLALGIALCGLLTLVLSGIAIRQERQRELVAKLDPYTHA